MGTPRGRGRPTRGAGDARSRRQQWRSLRSAIPRIPDLEFKPDRRIRAMTDPAIVAWLAEFHRQRDLTPDPAAPLPETWQPIRAALRVRASQQPERRPLRVRVIQPVVGGDLDTYRGLGDRLDELVRTYRTAFGEGRSPNGPELDLR